MHSGEMNIPFLVQVQSLIADGEGGHIAQWATVASVWGKIQSLEDTTPLSLNNDPARLTHAVVMRSRSDFEISAAHRLVYEEQAFQVRKVIRDFPDKGSTRLFVTQTQYLN